ncbi:orotate phosphoribosyltransferase [Candidatus Nucleicultrix amoebiphila FS5]|uniref:Orotate phosphoribosyltransferase n=2 Tax=Candidatus Nucleicultrix TaxID=1509243 RepID=A0A1W6N4S7_9PROT|nr:orotate phosphoribosyltransferase [Candidatus Nucleicultrix amoebiphila FS5]
MWATFCHLSGLAGYLIPFGHLIAPLIIWLMKRQDSDLIDRNGKEALNFQLSVTLYGVVASILIFVLVGLALLFALAIFQAVCVIIASIKTNDGIAYRYPLTIRFIQ